MSRRAAILLTALLLSACNAPQKQQDQAAAPQPAPAAAPETAGPAGPLLLARLTKGST